MTVRPKSGGPPYKFRYATLDAVIEHAREELTKNGLWFTQTTSWDAGNHVLIIHTTLWHKEGQWISGDMPVSDASNDQALGSSLTYRKRYALCGLLGIAADSDDDANAADGNEVTDRKEKLPETPSGNEAKAKAMAFAQDAVKFLTDVKSAAALSDWQEKNLGKIARLRAYDASKHEDVVNMMKTAEVQLNGES